MKKLILLWKQSNIQEKLLALYIVSLPLMKIPALSFFGKKILYADIIFLCLLGVFIRKLIQGKIKILKTSLEGPLIIMVTLFIVSFLNSINLMDSFVELAGLIYLIILLMIIVNIINTRDKLIYFLYIWIIVACFISIFGLSVLFASFINREIIKNNPFLFYDTIESMAHHFARIHSIIGNANMFLAYLHASLVFSIILFILTKNIKLRLFISANIFLILVTAFFTGSRRFSGLLLTFFILLCWFGKGKITAVLKYLAFLGFVVVSTIAFITTIWVVFPIKVTRDEITKIATMKVNYAYSIHYLSPAVAMNMFKKHPFIGVGFGTFNRNFKENVDWKWLESSFGFEAYPNYFETVKDKSTNIDPHSVVFGALAETGLFGLLALIYFFSRYMFLLIERLKKSGQFTFQKIVYGCILAGYVGFLLNAVTFDILSVRYFWFMLAIGMTYYEHNHQNKKVTG